MRVFIDGAEGTTGLRLHERLRGRSDLRLLKIDPEKRKDADERARISNAADVVFLCLPDQAAKEAVQGIVNPRTTIIDASTAHRTNPDWAYGLPELSAQHRNLVSLSRRIAVPGCHASGFLSLVYPLVKEGMLPADYPLSCHSLTGYSGAGKPMIAKYDDAQRAAHYAFPRQYALGLTHKHLPEMQIVAKLRYEPVFNPIIDNFYAGMEVTVPIHTRLLSKRMSAEALQVFFAEYYAGQRFIQVQPYGAHEAFEGGMIDAGALAGLDYMQIFVCGREDQAVLIARFDNLGKGASGAAIQCMNIACGFDEAEGLCL